VVDFRLYLYKIIIKITIKMKKMILVRSFKGGGCCGPILYRESIV